MTDLENGIALVESAIKQMNIDPVACRGKIPGQYTMVQGSIQIWIDIFFSEKENACYFQVMSPILSLNGVTNSAALYEELLKINDGFYNVAFTIYDNTVWLKNIREVKGLDESEIIAQIRRVGTYGDQYDDILKQKYMANYKTPGVVGSPPPQ